MVICPLAAQHHMLVCCPFSVTGTDPMMPGLQQPVRNAARNRTPQAFIFAMDIFLLSEDEFTKGICSPIHGDDSSKNVSRKEKFVRKGYYKAGGGTGVLARAGYKVRNAVCLTGSVQTCGVFRSLRILNVRTGEDARASIETVVAKQRSYGPAQWYAVLPLSVRPYFTLVAVASISNRALVVGSSILLMKVGLPGLRTVLTSDVMSSSTGSCDFSSRC